MRFAIIGLLCIVVLSGCGKQAAQPEVKAGLDHDMGSGENVATVKLKLAEAEKLIADRERELAMLKNNAKSLPKTATESKPTDGKVYRTPEELLSGIPKEAYPLSGNSGTIERSASNKWLNSNITGKTIEFAGKIDDTHITEEKSGNFTVTLYASNKSGYSVEHGFGIVFKKMNCKLFGGVFTIGNERCIAYFDGIVQSEDNFRIFYHCNSDEAKKLRDLTGKDVVFSSQVSKSIFESDISEKFTNPKLTKDGIEIAEGLKDVKLLLRVYLSAPYINGYIPNSQAKQDTP